MAITKPNKALKDLEGLRDAALEKIKTRAGKLRAILDERDRFLKESYAREQEEHKAKARESGDVVKFSEAISRVEAKIPQEVSRDLQRREGEIRELERRKKEHGRELHGVKHDLTTLERRPGPRDQIVFRTLRDQVAALEALVAEVDVDLDDAKKGLEAAQTIRRETLDGLVEECEKELAALVPASA